jgi:hypothetical protein
MEALATPDLPLAGCTILLLVVHWHYTSLSSSCGFVTELESVCLNLNTTRAGPLLGPLEGTELGFTALPWAPLGWRQLQTYQDVFC